MPVAPAAALVYLKLKSPRAKDAADVVELFKQGLDPVPIRAYITEHAPDLDPRLDRLIATALAEE